ncbi:MAG: hypothetical protein QM762_14600 [Chryseolinea sp.]
MSKSTVAISFLLVLCSACLLVREEENFKDVPKTPKPAYIGNVYYSVTGGNYYPLQDTLWLASSAYLDIQNGVVYDYEASVDGEVVRPYSQGRERFVLEKGNTQPGVHQLEIIQRVKSGTNSLADKAEVEYVEYKKAYVLMIGDPNFVPEITSVKVVNGTLRIEWKAFTQGNFDGFILRKYSGFGYMAQREFKINDQKSNHFIDSTFVGGDVRYDLQVNQGGLFKNSPSKSIYVPYLSNLTLSRVSEGRLKLSWNTPPLIKNVDHFSISIGREILQDNIAPSTRSIEFNGTALFGETKSYYIEMDAKIPDAIFRDADRFGNTEQLMVGERLRSFRSIKYNNAKQAFFLTHEQYIDSRILGIYKLNNDLQVIDSTLYTSDDPTEFYLSPNGQYMYLFTGRQVEQFDPNDLSKKVTYTLPDIGIQTGYFDSFTYDDYFRVSNNNILLLRQYYWNYLVDMNQRKVIFQLPPGGNTHLSADGNYLINNTSLYRASGGTYVLDTTLPYSTISYVQFFDDEPSVLLVVTDSKVIKYDCASRTELISWNVVANYRPHLVQSSKKLFHYVSGKYFPDQAVALLDLETGTIQKQINVRGDWIRFDKNILFDRRGFALRDY